MLDTFTGQTWPGQLYDWSSLLETQVGFSFSFWFCARGRSGGGFASISHARAFKFTSVFAANYCECVCVSGFECFVGCHKFITLWKIIKTEFIA